MTATIEKLEKRRLLEISTMGGTRVDREASIIRGVKILGAVSANGRTYTESARRNAVGLYEGVRVNVNHMKGAGDRSYYDRLGILRNVESRSDGLYGDLHYNPKHALAEQLAWDAENQPGNVGLSHDAEGKTRIDRGNVLVEEITRVRSVDLVSDPATVQGLFESKMREMAAAMEPGGSSDVDDYAPGSIKDPITGEMQHSDKPTDLCLRSYRKAIMDVIDNSDDIPATLKKVEKLKARDETLASLEVEVVQSDETIAALKQEEEKRKNWAKLPGTDAAKESLGLGSRKRTDKELKEFGNLLRDDGNGSTPPPAARAGAGRVGYSELTEAFPFGRKPDPDKQAEFKRLFR